MKKLFCSIVALFALVSMSSCAGGKAVEASNLSGKWSLVSVKGEVLSFTETPFFEFNMIDNTVHGKSGCNLFNSSLNLDANDASAVSFNMPRSTMMACQDMENEGKILRSFDAVKSVKAGENESEIVLVDVDGKEIFRLQKN